MEKPDLVSEPVFQKMKKAKKAEQKAWNKKGEEIYKRDQVMSKWARATTMNKNNEPEKERAWEIFQQVKKEYEKIDQDIEDFRKETGQKLRKADSLYPPDPPIPELDLLLEQKFALADCHSAAWPEPEGEFFLADRAGSPLPKTRRSRGGARAHSQPTQTQ